MEIVDVVVNLKCPRTWICSSRLYANYIFFRVCIGVLLCQINTNLAKIHNHRLRFCSNFAEFLYQIKWSFYFFFVEPWGQSTSYFPPVFPLATFLLPQPSFLFRNLLSISQPCQVSTLSNQIIPFVSCSITINHVTISAHYYYFLGTNSLFASITASRQKYFN